MTDLERRVLVIAQQENPNRVDLWHKLIEKVLDENGFGTDFSDPQTLPERLRSFTYSAVIVDLSMVDDPYGLIRKARQQSRDLTILAARWSFGSQDIRDTFVAGATDVFRKDLEEYKLLDELKQTILRPPVNS